jgi:hypothetical protein
MDTELKPCPHCGADVILTEHEPHDHSPALVAIGLPGKHPGSFTIECVSCECGMINATHEGVIDAWNRRTPSAPAVDGARDEREAFEAKFPLPGGVKWDGTKYYVREGWGDSYRCDRFIGQWEAWQARAALATAPEQAGEAVAQWQAKLLDPTMPECATWIDISEEGANTIREKYAHVYKVRALYERTAPPAASTNRLTDEQRKHIARIVHTDCTLIPGATFYNAAELAIEATLAALYSGSAPPICSRDCAAECEYCRDMASASDEEPSICVLCGGSGFVDDGEITGSGGVEYENGPVQCVKDCPACAASGQKLSPAVRSALEACAMTYEMNGLVTVATEIRALLRASSTTASDSEAQS